MTTITSSTSMKTSATPTVSVSAGGKNASVPVTGAGEKGRSVSFVNSMRGGSKLIMNRSS